MPASKIIRPSTEFKDSYIQAVHEWHAENLYEHIDIETLKTSFDDFIKSLCSEKESPHRPFQDWVEPVPETVLWLVKDKEYIGTVKIRHRLNWHLEKWGGHISIDIRPSMRNKGFGRKILKKSIPFANYLGVEKALITINPDNESAIKIIEFCGGVRDEITPETEQFPSQIKYWIDCT